MAQRIPLTLSQKILLTVGSSVGALVNPLRGGLNYFPGSYNNVDLVATLGEVTGTFAARTMRDSMLLTKTGRDILRTKSRVSSESLCMEKLGQLPMTTFGKQHYLFFQNHKISPNTRSEVQYIHDDELAYVLQRYRENHDFMHTLCGLSISVAAELGLKWFEFRQTGLPMTLLGSIFGPLALPFSDMRDFYNIYLPWAEKASKECRNFMTFDFETLLQMDIEKVRQLMNLKPFPC
jgi:ubiquinone biosynthesis protein COQ4